MVIHFCRSALVGRADSMGDFTHRAVVAWLSECWDGSEDMFWDVDPEFAERNRLKLEEECIDMAIRAMLVLVRDCPSLRVFMAHRIDEELRRESLRTGQVADIDSYSLVPDVRHSDVWNERIDVVNAGNRAHRCADGEWTMACGCMVLAGHASEDLRDVLLGRRPLSGVPKGECCELEDKHEDKIENGKETD